MDRRTFVKLAASGVACSVLGCKVSGGGTGTYRFGYAQTNYLRPPGALPENLFLEGCINCALCAEVCCRGAIRFFTDGFEGKVQPQTPYIVAAEAGCDLCLACTQICPTGVLQPVAKAEDVDMGMAVLEENLCLPYINQGGCGACYTVCPVNAVRLEAQRYPKVIDDKCVGCGLCEEVCLQKAKAIRIKPA